MQRLKKKECRTELIINIDSAFSEPRDLLLFVSFDVLIALLGE